MPRLVGRRGGAASGLLAALTVGVLTAGLAACGSQLDPNTVTQENGQTGANPSAGGGVPSAGSTDAGGALPTTTGGSGDTSGGGSLPGTTTGGSTTHSGGSTSAPSTGSSPGGGGHRTPTAKPSSSSTGSANSCDGLQNTTGITDSTITIGNSSDISGPVPGLFQSSQDAVKAFVAYFNSSSDICGRKLQLATYDSRTDASADQQAYAAACDQVFAMVGSMSAFDSGGAATDQACGLPDLRSAAVTKERDACTTCFGAQSTNTGQYENAVPDFVLHDYGDAAQHAAFLYINEGAAAENAQVQASAMTKRGMHFDYVQGIDVSEFNYAPYVQQLVAKGIQTVFWTGAYQESVRLRQAMAQQGYTPKLYLRDPTDYNPDYVSTGGSAVDGTVVYTNFVPFEEASSNKEEQTYLAWLQQVHPGAQPTFFGLFSWSAARLFVQEATKLGGKLTRASLVQDLKGVDNWTDNGMHAPQHVGSKQTSECWRFIQLNGGNWQPVDGTKYQCSGLTAG